MKIRRSLIIGLLFIPLFLSGCAKTPEATKEIKTYVPEVSVITIQPGLQNEFEVTGEVAAFKISRITSELRGTIKDIDVKIGDTVKQGDNLLELDSAAIESSFQTAGTTLQNAQLSKESTELSVQKSIEAAEVSLETAKTNLQNTLRQNRTLKDQAQEVLNSAKLSLELSVSAARTSLDNAIKNALPAVQSVYNICNRILGVEEAYEFYDEDFRKSLGALNRTTKTNAENAVKKVKALMSAFDNSYESALQLLSSAEIMTDLTLETIHSSVVGANYTQSQITTDENTVTPYLTTIRTSLTTLEAAKSALDSAKQETEDDDAQALKSARAAYDATIAQLETAEETAGRAVESAEIALENAKQSANLSKVSAQTSVSSAYGNYDQARINKDKLIIKAPFDGKISDMPIKTGEEVNPGTHLLTIEDDSRLTITAYLSSSDINKISHGDIVLINNDREIAQISSISPSADPVTKKYKVQMEHEENGIKAGELVKLTFMTSNGGISEKIFIPLPSLHILPDETFVWKVHENKTVKNVVETGEIQGDFVEIVSGLRDGDVIIHKGGRIIEDEGTEVQF